MPATSADKHQVRLPSVFWGRLRAFPNWLAEIGPHVFLRLQWRNVLGRRRPLDALVTTVDNKDHVTLGELIIQGLPNQEEVLSAVSSHHERCDGEGYPRGLKGEGIPMLGRLLAVTDAYSAMTTDRPYRKALLAMQAKEEPKRVSGTQLDPQLVEIFLEVLEEEEAGDETRVAVFASGRF
jgi:response regulator RpfG family c-di-GMP phosphodiesterase